MPYSGSRNTPYSAGEASALIDVSLDQISDVQLTLPVENNQHLVYNGGVWTNDYTQKTFIRVRNETLSTITKGSVVHVNDVQNQNIVKVILADASDPTKMPAIGIVLDNIDPNNNGLAVSYGRADGVDTTGFVLGETLYVSNVAGQVSNVKPLAETDKIQNIGICIKVGNNGSVFVTGVGRANDIPNAEILPDDTSVEYVYVNTSGQDFKKIDPLLLNTKVPNLQAVTDVGSTTTNGITVNTLNITNPVAGQTSSLIYYNTSTDATSYGALPNLQQITDVGSITTNGVTVNTLNITNPVAGQTSSLIYYNTSTDATSYGALPNLQQTTDVGSTTTNSITAKDLTLTGVTAGDDLTITELNGDWTIQNSGQNNKIVIYDDTEGVEVYYGATKRLEIDSTANKLLDQDVYIEDRLIVGSTSAPTHQLVVRKNGGTIGTSLSSAFGFVLDSNEADNGMIINSTTNGYIRFGDAVSPSVAGFQYSHTSDELIFRAGSVSGMTLGPTLATVDSIDFQVGSATQYVYVDWNGDNRLQLHDTTGRPYISFYNNDATPTKIRKGYLGYPSTGSNSDIYLTSDTGDVLINAQGKIFRFREEGYFQLPGETGVTASCATSIGAGSTGTNLSWTTPSNSNGTFLSNPDTTFTIPVAGYYWVSVYGVSSGFPGAVVFGTTVVGTLALYYGGYQQIGGSFSFINGEWRGGLDFTRYFPVGTNIFSIRMSNPGTAAVTFTGTLNMRLICQI